MNDTEEAFVNEEAIYHEDTFKYSDYDIMSNEEEDSGPGNDRAAAIYVFHFEYSGPWLIIKCLLTVS